MDVITTHINADFDCLGSMIAARKLYPDAEMVFSGAQERSLREFFLRSAVYVYGFKRIRDIALEDITRLILVDVRQSARIGPFGEVALRKGVEVHIYDHHPAGPADLHGSVERIESVGSTVTVFCHLFMERGIHPDPDEATMMMLGLYEDTGNLLFNSTTIRDYQAAAFLHSHGANLSTVSDFLTQEMTSDQVALLHELIKSRKVFNVRGVEISLAHASTDHFVGDLAVLAHKLKDMENLDALLVAVRMGDRIFMVGRSRSPEVPMGEILQEFGGGGHPFAAAATIKEETLIQVLDRIPALLLNHVRPHWEARHLMSSPVKTVSRNESISEVRKILTRYNINALPVMDGEKVIGIITRQIAEKAAHHGLSDVPVEEYMSGEFAEVSPETPMDVLQDMIVERHQRFVPVLEDGRLVGAITRTDLLRHLISGGERNRSEGQTPGSGEGVLRKKQVIRLMKDQLPQRILNILKEMGTVGEAMGIHVFAVGGFVRDLLLRQPNFDVDIVVEGDGIAFASEFARCNDCRIRAHRKFGTAVVVFPDEFKMDIASTRMEYYMEPGALPTVEHASIKLDLYRRDFTINTLAVSLKEGEFGELLDFFGAQRDLKEKAIRVLHNLSFVEDSTRVFRAIRFEQRLGFQMGPHTEQLLKSAVRMGFIEKVGGPRVFNELTIILKEPDPLPAVLRMAELDVLKYIHPALSATAQLEQFFDAAGRAVHWYELLYIGEPCRKWQVYFLCLTAGLDRDAMKGICGRLGIPPRICNVFTEERVQAHQSLRELERRSEKRPFRPSRLYRLLHGFSTEILLYLMARAGREEARRRISYYFTHLRHVTTQISGHDLKNMGIPPGPVYSEILEDLLNARLNGRVSTREDELERVCRRYRKHMGKTAE